MFDKVYSMAAQLIAPHPHAVVHPNGLEYFLVETTEEEWTGEQQGGGKELIREPWPGKVKSENKHCWALEGL